jgi:hypothetical protein
MLDEALEDAPSAAAYQGTAIGTATEDPARAADIMANAARECGCRGIDMDLMEAGTVFASRPAGRDHRVLRTIVTPDAAASDRITLPTDATFADLAQAIGAREQSGATSPVWIEML